MPPSQRLENKKRTERVFLLSLLLLWDVFLFFLLLFVGRSCFFSDRSASIPLPVFTCSPTAPLSLHLCRLYLFCITRTHTPCVCMCVRVRSCPSALLFICVSPMSEARHASRSHLRRIYFISSRTRTRAHGQLCESLCVLDLLLLMLCARADIVHVSPPLPLPSLSPLTPRNRHIKALCKAKNRQARGKEEEAAGRRERERKKIIQLLFPCVCADRLVSLLFFSPLPSLPHSLSHKHGLFLSLFFLFASSLYGTLHIRYCCLLCVFFSLLLFTFFFSALSCTTCGGAVLLLRTWGTASPLPHSRSETALATRRLTRCFFIFSLSFSRCCVYQNESREKCRSGKRRQRVGQRLLQSLSFLSSYWKVRTGRFGYVAAHLLLSVCVRVYWSVPLPLSCSSSATIMMSGRENVSAK